MIEQLDQRVSAFERDPAATPPDELRSLSRAVNAFYDDDVQAEVTALRHRVEATLKARKQANTGRELQPTPAAGCRTYEETPITNAEVIAASKRDLLRERRRIARAVRKGRGHGSGGRVHRRSRCRRDSKRRSSARSGDGGPDGEPSPALERALAEAEQAIERFRRELADEQWSEQ